MTLAADTCGTPRSNGLFADLARVVRRHLPRPRSAPDHEPESPDDALLRALRHDMRTPLASLEAALRHLGRAGEVRPELVELARAQAEHLSSMLRTAAVAAAPLPRRPTGSRSLGDVIRASTAASGLPSDLLMVVLDEPAASVTVADARVQRILTNLLENAHRHGKGAPVLLSVTR